jgi:hypothetical protein
LNPSAMSWSMRILQGRDSHIDECMGYYERLAQKDIYHSPRYIQVLAEHYEDEGEWFVFGNDDEYIYYPYLRRRLDKLEYLATIGPDLSKYSDITSSWYYGGPIYSRGRGTPEEGLVEGFLAAFDAHCQESGIVSEFIRFDPNLRNGQFFDGWLPVSVNRQTVVVDLTKTEEEVWEGLASRNRNRLRRAAKHGLEMECRRDDEAIAIFQRIYAREMERKSALSHYRFSKEFFLSLFERCSDHFYLLLFRLKDAYVGGIVCAWMGGIVHDYLRSSLAEYWTMNLNNWMVLQSILHAKAQGCVLYDLQGGKEGVFHFKSGFSRLRRDFLVCARVHIPQVYEQLCVGSSPESVSFFPAYREKESN